MMPDGLNNINDRAQDSFNKLKTKMKLDLQAPLIKEGIEINQEKIQQMLNQPKLTSYEKQFVKENPALEQAVEVVEFVDNTFDFIESLKLPPTLSLTIAKIISYNKTNNKGDLLDAKNILEDAFNEVTK